MEKIVRSRQSGNGMLSEDQLELIAEKIAEKEMEAKERLQIMRDLFPKDDEELLMQGRIPSNMIMPLARYITWTEAANPSRQEPLARIYLRTLLRLLIGKEGDARYETLAAYQSHVERRETEEEGEL